MSDATSIDSARDRRWLILGVIGLAQAEARRERAQ
jgi:hypothetical protein